MNNPLFKQGGDRIGPKPKRGLIRNNTQTAVTNIAKNRMLKNKLFNLKFRRTFSEVTVCNTSNN